MLGFKISFYVAAVCSSVQNAVKVSIFKKKKFLSFLVGFFSWYMNSLCTPFTFTSLCTLQPGALKLTVFCIKKGFKAIYIKASFFSCNFDSAKFRGLRRTHG